MSEEEQEIWDALRDEMDDDSAWSRYPGAELTYTQQVHDALIEFWRTEYNPEYFEEMQKKTKVGDGASGTILIDYGAATVCLGEDPLTRESALPLMRMIAPVSGVSRDDVRMSELDEAFESVYRQFSWMQPQQNPHYSTTRSLTDGEFLNLSRLKTEYLLSGLRPSTPLLTAETPDGGLWLDAHTNTIHLPMRYALTDEEMLHYIELVDSLTRQTLLKKVPDMITQQQAEWIAGDWANKLFGLNTDELSVFTELYDEDFLGKSSAQPVWRVRIGPEDMLVRLQNADYEFDGCELLLDGRDGTLTSASRLRYASTDTSAREGKSAKQVQSDLKNKAIQTVRDLFADGSKPSKAVISGYNFVETKDSYDADVNMMHSISYVVSMPGGVDYQLDFTTGDYALISYRYWPDGCKDRG